MTLPSPPCFGADSSRTLKLDGQKENPLQLLGKGPDDVRIVAGTNVLICDKCVQLRCDISWPDEAFPWSVPESHA